MRKKDEGVVTPLAHADRDGGGLDHPAGGGDGAGDHDLGIARRDHGGGADQRFGQHPHGQGFLHRPLRHQRLEQVAGGVGQRHDAGQPLGFEPPGGLGDAGVVAFRQNNGSLAGAGGGKGGVERGHGAMKGTTRAGVKAV